MAIVRKRSRAIIDLENNVKLGCDVAFAELKWWRGDSLTIDTTDSSDSTYIICELPITAVLYLVHMANTPMASCTIDVGFYHTLKNGGAAIDRIALNNNIPLDILQNNFCVLDLSYHSAADAGFPIWKALWPSIKRPEDVPYTSVNLVATLQTPTTSLAGAMHFLVGAYV
jgi:hypothetical protein